MKSKKLKIDPIMLFSHELKTPLSSLKLALHLLESRSKKDKKIIQLMKNEVEQMTLFICSHLDLKLLKEKKELINPEWHSWNKMISKVLKTFQLISKEKNIKLRVRSCPDFEAFVDPIWMAQALKNLLSNAIRFSPKNSVVLIDCELNKGGVQCSIINRKKNSSKEISKLEKTDSFFLKNTGFGLTIVKMIIENHNGSFNVQSNKKNFIASFFIPKIQEIKKSA